MDSVQSLDDENVRDRSVADRLRLQSHACARMGSHLYEALLEYAARDYDNGGAVRAFYDADAARGCRSRTGLRLMAAFHYCALDASAPQIAAHFPSCGGDGDAALAWKACRKFLIENSSRIGVLHERILQTNEVTRAAMLLAGTLRIAHEASQPLRLFEVGASAGLNLRMDHYRYEGERWCWGPTQSAAVVRLREEHGYPCALDAHLRISERRACDLHPIDANNERDRLTLASFVWSDQHERFERLQAALRIAHTVPVQVERADMVVWLSEHVRPMPGYATVVMHSVVTEHMPAHERIVLRALIDHIAQAAHAQAPLAWLRMEPLDGLYQTRVTLWPGQRELAIAKSDAHGNSIYWD
jgi:hypothetical protein